MPAQVGERMVVGEEALRPGAPDHAGKADRGHPLELRRGDIAVLGLDHPAGARTRAAAGGGGHGVVDRAVVGHPVGQRVVQRRGQDEAGLGRVRQVTVEARGDARRIDQLELVRDTHGPEIRIDDLAHPAPPLCA